MAKENKADMSCARVKKYSASDVSKAERHNERKNETYENMNVIVERIPFNVHFKKPTAPTYMEQLKQMETDGQVSLRGLRKDATLFNEIVIDVNTMYFERNGGYEYAKQFYEEAYHFIEEKFGSDNVISAVMHADEINVAASEELGKEVYHYHLHAMVLPVVEKEILWSKRCKDEKLRGTVKEVVNQISHSKKWKSDIPMTDEKGNPLLRKNGKPMFRASYSILQDELFHYMTEQGFKGFQRGEYGSTAEHLTSLQYQIQQDKERLEKLQKRIQKEQVKYEPARHISKTLNEIYSMGQKTFTGKMAISQKDYSELTALAKEGITSRAEIKKFEQSANFYRQKYMDSAKAIINELEGVSKQVASGNIPILQEKTKIYIDMDGTIARFHDENLYLERMFEKGFFRDLKPFENAVAAIEKLANDSTAEIYILSATLNSCSLDEKNQWLDKYLPNIDKDHRIFTSLNVPKSEAIGHQLTDKDILIDDYNKNLLEWEKAGGSSVKAKNNINHKGLHGELWKGEIVDVVNGDIYSDICKLANENYYYAYISQSDVEQLKQSGICYHLRMSGERIIAKVNIIDKPILDNIVDNNRSVNCATGSTIKI